MIKTSKLLRLESFFKDRPFFLITDLYFQFIRTTSISLKKAFRINCFIIHLKPLLFPLVPFHEIFIQQGFKFPVIESDLIKLIDSSGGHWEMGGGGYNVKLNLNDKEIQYLLCKFSTSHAIFTSSICKNNFSQKRSKKTWKFLQMQ
jgi:hypothetical protein